VTPTAAVDVLIVGAGLAGLSSARDLTRAGFAVRVLDKSKGVGGRAATRRLEGAVLDHGAPFFTARGARFTQLVRTLEARGIVRTWTHGFHDWRDGVLLEPRDGFPRFSPPAGMNALGKALREGVDFGDEPLEVQQEALVSAVWNTSLGWSAVLESGEILNARAILVTTPAPQALAITHSSLEPRTRQALEGVTFDPCWSVMATLEATPKLPWKAVKLHHPVLEWASLEHTKRTTSPALVLHATAAWSAARLEQTQEQIIPPVLEAMRDVFGNGLDVKTAVAHRWRYAKAGRQHPEPILTQHDLVFCGDWCDADGHASRVENALESGWAAAAYLGDHLEQPMSAILTGAV
jgi:renalase